MTTTPTGVPIIDCPTCGHRHPIIREHCSGCGLATLFPCGGDPDCRRLGHRPATVGALFAGYGGLEMGLSEVFETHLRWVSEIDRGACAILAHHHPDVPNLGDISAVDWDQVEPVDILTGGFPCQDVSHAGRRRGLGPGTRTGLWSRMADVIDHLRPRLVIAENVRGLLSAEAACDVEPCPWCVGGAGDGEPPLRALGAVVADLADLGYDAAWVGLRAADVGAPHGRFRVFILAWPQGDAGPLTWPQGDAGPLTWPQGDAGPLLPTPAVNDMGTAYTPETWDAWTERMRAEHGNGNGHGASLAIEALRLLPTPMANVADNGGSQHPDKRRAGGHSPTIADVVEHLLPTPTAMDSRASGGVVGSSNVTLTDAVVRPHERGIDFGRYTPAVHQWETVLGRPAPSPTEPTGLDGAHRLSPAFVEWMQGLPAGHVTTPTIWGGWTPSAARNAQLRALGNGVVPQQAAHAIRWLLDVRATALSGRWVA